jgi:hypothetical protein
MSERRCKARWRAGLALATLVAAAAPAFAQSTPGTPGALPPNIEERARPTEPVSPLSVPPEELILTGQNDIVLLEQRQLFELDASSGFNFTNNAFLSNQHRVGDIVFNNAASMRAATTIDQTYDVYASADVATSSHAINPVLDFDDLGGSVGTEFPFQRVRLGFSYTVTDVLSSGFNRHLLTLNDFASSISYPISYNGAAVAPKFTVTRSITDPGSYTSTEIRIGVGFTYPIRADIGVFGSPSVFYRDYDNYFENITGVPRRDNGLDVPVGIVWTPVPWLAATMQVDVSYNNSSVPQNTYDAVSATPSVRLTYRF